MAVNLLVLGGTSWLSGAVARHGLERGHRVTALARGESGHAPRGVAFVRADRWASGAYDEVAGRHWDAVVDVSWQPVLVRSALAVLSAQAGHWTYVSSCSVYCDDATPDADESAPTHRPWAGSGSAPVEDYGPAKVACEMACHESVAADRLLLARSGLIGGYGDRSDRFGYWPCRLDRVRHAESDRVLVPPLDASVQVIDVEDLAAWIVRTGEQGTSGTFNAVGHRVSLREVLTACAQASGSAPPPYLEVDQDFLADHAIAPWSGPDSLPLWLPQPDYAGFMTRRNTAAERAGLHLRPLSETAAGSLTWERELGLDRDRMAGLTPAKEAAIRAESTDRFVDKAIHG